MPETETGKLEFIRPKLLLVEGADDERFLSGLLQVMGLRPTFQIAVYEGKDSLKKFLNAALLASSFKSQVKSVGIIRDADEQGIERSRQSIYEILYRTGLSEHQAQLQSKNPDLRIGVHILCDSTGKGRLEEMILKAVAESWQMLCVDSFQDCLEEQMPPEKKFARVGKARLSLFLAAQRQTRQADYWHESADELRLDIAAKARYLNLKHPVYDDLKRFLQEL